MPCHILRVLHDEWLEKQLPVRTSFSLLIREIFKGLNIFYIYFIFILIFYIYFISGRSAKVFYIFDWLVDWFFLIWEILKRFYIFSALDWFLLFALHINGQKAGRQIKRPSAFWQNHCNPHCTLHCAAIESNRELSKSLKVIALLLLIFGPNLIILFLLL